MTFVIMPGCDLEVLSVLFAQLAGLAVERVFTAGESMRIQARTSSAGSDCPVCGVRSIRVHSRYERRLADAAAGGQEMFPSRFLLSSRQQETAGQ
jgi:hypothetical protein